MLRGSEKQIKWAEDIIARAYAAIAEQKEKFDMQYENRMAKGKEDMAEVSKKRAEECEIAKAYLDRKLAEDKYTEAAYIIKWQDNFKVFTKCRYWENANFNPLF